MNKSLIFLSDTPPLKNKGSGISVLLYNILNALKKDYTLSVITFCNGASASSDEIFADNESVNVLICDKNFYRLYKLIRFGILKRVLQLLGFLMSIPSIIGRYNKPDTIFITVVGASIRPVYKGWLLKKLLPGAKHCLYVVDDLELINKKYNNRYELFLISLFLKATIKQTDLLINISDGLKQLYFNKYGVNSLVLPPHFNAVPLLNTKTVKNATEFTFLFTGGLNILYNDSLKFFASAIEELNEQQKGKMLFKLLIQTYSPYSDFEALNLNTAYTTYSTNANRSKLLNLYQDCDCFLVPYSFAAGDMGMVVTSFPQKIAEIIQYGKKILVFGPSYSSVNIFFKNNELDFICDQNLKDSLKLKIQEVVGNNLDTNKYLNAYGKHLSARAVVEVFNQIIKQLYK